VSFRSRLTLFFVLIVIVPMLAVAFLLFRLIDQSATDKQQSASSAQHRVVGRLFTQQQKRAQAALVAVAHDEVFASSLQDHDFARARARASQLIDREGTITRILFVRGSDVLVSVGDRLAIAPASQMLQSSTHVDLGRLEVSITDASTYVSEARDLTDLQTIVVNGGKVLASTLPIANQRALAPTPPGEVTISDTGYREQRFQGRPSFAGQQIRVVTFARTDTTVSASANRTFAGAILAGFLLLAIACAMLVSRTLQREISGFLTAARKLAAGDFSAQIPTVGHDEFAALGEEFNKMSLELEGRLAELSQQRGRVQDSMRRLGEAVAANLDRDALLELVVRTAVDGVGADAGRACVRSNGSGVLDERSRVGTIDGLEVALRSVENDALSSGSACEATLGSATAIAHPLRGAEGHDAVVGVVSVARTGSPFTAGDRDLFAYLAGQVARSMENVELHETTARQSVTDELTGISNRRAFDDALSGEIERSRRFGSDLGLVLIDLDDFKVVNDTYGHPQGDVVLREVARVLRESSREIDHPARYGGEELAVILPGTDMEGAFNRAERVREQIARLHIARLDGRGTLRITASCGVAAVRATSADGRVLLQSADRALYEAKRAGKNKSVRAR
jgi:diguanylate cyclase (GGDEF)-like protein